MKANHDWNHPSHALRGIVINVATILEKSIDSYISKYLSSIEEKQNEIYYFLLDRMTYEGKRTAFEAILKKNNTQEEFKRTSKKLIDDIRKVIYQRNYFAHFLINFDPIEAVNHPGEIGFIEFRDGEKTVWYSREKMIKFVELTNKCILEIQNLTDNL